MQKIQIRSYQKAWQIDKKIYAYLNVKFPVPIHPKAILYWLIIFLITWLLNWIIPILQGIPMILKYLIFPVVLTQVGLKLKLDGKKPHRYFLAWLSHLAHQTYYIERFNSISPQQDQDFKLTWFCSRGMED